MLTSHSGPGSCKQFEDLDTRFMQRRPDTSPLANVTIHDSHCVMRRKYPLYVTIIAIFCGKCRGVFSYSGTTGILRPSSWTWTVMERCMIEPTFFCLGVDTSENSRITKPFHYDKPCYRQICRATAFPDRETIIRDGNEIAHDESENILSQGT